MYNFIYYPTKFRSNTTHRTTMSDTKKKIIFLDAVLLFSIVVMDSDAEVLSSAQNLDFN